MHSGRNWLLGFHSFPVQSYIFIGSSALLECLNSTITMLDLSLSIFPEVNECRFGVLRVCECVWRLVVLTLAPGWAAVAACLSWMVRLLTETTSRQRPGSREQLRREHPQRQHLALLFFPLLTHTIRSGDDPHRPWPPTSAWSPGESKTCLRPCF